MTAISKSFVTIADSAVDPDSPLDTTLMTGIRDNLVHLREWLGASFTAAAVQDHNHDGSNSAAIDIGPNLLRNGSFESADSGWTLTAYTGGSLAVGASNANHGGFGLSIVSTVLANGGGYATSNEYIPVGSGQQLDIRSMLDASVANISSKLEVIWYDSAKAQISVAVAYSTIATSTTAAQVSGSVTAPATARFFKVRVTGGIPASGSAVGTIYFDGVVATYAERFDTQIFTANGTWTKPSWARGDELALVEVWGGGGGSNGGGGGGGGAYAYKIFRLSELNATHAVIVGAGGGSGVAGGYSSFGGGKCLAYGGNRPYTAGYGAGGGGGLAAGGYIAGEGGTDGYFSTGGAGGATGGRGYGDAGGGGSTSSPGTGGGSYYGGGGGARNGGSDVGGASVYGGGGGGYTGGYSNYGGNGGSNGVNGVAPGGGAGPTASGARGEVRVTIFQ